MEPKFVITVAPQKDICPQGNTYPKKEVNIRKKIIITPKNHVNLLSQEWKYIPRPKWKKTKKKNSLAPFIWIKRSIHP